MRRIFKYQLPIAGDSGTAWPKGGELLDIQMQNGSLCAWVLVDPEETAMEDHLFAIYGTGHAVPDYHRRDRYVKTVQDGPFVWHIFRR